MRFCSANGKGGKKPACTAWKWAIIVLVCTPLGFLAMLVLKTAVLPQPASWVPPSGISKSLQLSRDYETKSYITPASRRSDDRVTSAKERVLVLYAYANTDPAYSENLRFFVREGLYADDGCRYVIIIQEGNGADKEVEALPRLPSNAQYVRHANECYDWGSYGWYLKQIDTTVYDFFVFMNSSVRGPFLPTYLRGKVHWIDMLLSKITGNVKLVGSTINCGPGPPPTDDIGAASRHNPHVQSYLVATDRDGLRILEEDGRVFQCHDAIADAIYYAEQGSALAIMGAGYNLDCLMLRYQGVNWRDRHNWNCNREVNPYLGEGFNDGMNMYPLETIFVKVKWRMLESRASAAEAAAKYSEWITDQYRHGQADVIKNEYLDNMDRFTIARVLYAAVRGSKCFDAAYYREHNPDLQAVMQDAASLWLHYVTEGQFESRPAIFHCQPAYTTMKSFAKKLIQDIN